MEFLVGSMAQNGSVTGPRTLASAPKAPMPRGCGGAEAPTTEYYYGDPKGRGAQGR